MPSRGRSGVHCRVVSSSLKAELDIGGTLAMTDFPNHLTLLAFPSQASHHRPP
jgi:hypothetical protein